MVFTYSNTVVVRFTELPETLQKEIIEIYNERVAKGGALIETNNLPSHINLKEWDNWVGDLCKKFGCTHSEWVADNRHLNLIHDIYTLYPEYFIDYDCLVIDLRW